MTEISLTSKHYAPAAEFCQMPARTSEGDSASAAADATCSAVAATAG